MVIRQVNDLINSYLSQPRTIILAVIPANQDIATIDILERATVMDPMGIRTLGVLTKPDLIGPGNEDEVLEVLCNRRKPLVLGYIMLKNLSQKQVNEGALRQNSSDEELFFRSHPSFSALIAQGQSHLFGTKNLIRQLIHVLVANIRRALPEIRRELEVHRQSAAAELQVHLRLHGSLPSDFLDKQTMILNKIAEYCAAMRQSCRGDYRSGVLSLGGEEHRLHRHMQRAYEAMQKEILAQRPASTPLLAEQLAQSLAATAKHMEGRELCCFPNYQVVSCTVTAMAELWRPFMESCVEAVLQMVRDVSRSLAAAVVSATAPRLAQVLQEIALEMVEAAGGRLREMSGALLEREANQPFTAAQTQLLKVVNKIRNRDFETALRESLDSFEGESLEALRSHLQGSVGQWYLQRHGGDARKNASQEMVPLIQAYWDIASVRFVDNVCMCFETEIANKFSHELETQCFVVAITLDERRVDELLEESPAVRQQLDKLRGKIERVEQAIAAIQQLAPVAVAAPLSSSF